MVLIARASKLLDDAKLQQKPTPLTPATTAESTLAGSSSATSGLEEKSPSTSATSTSPKPNLSPPPPSSPPLSSPLASKEHGRLRRSASPEPAVAQKRQKTEHPPNHEQATLKRKRGHQDGSQQSTRQNPAPRRTANLPSSQSTIQQGETRGRRERIISSRAAGLKSDMSRLFAGAVEKATVKKRR